MTEPGELGESAASIESYAELARRILAGPARLGRTRLVAIDGPSGAGKTMFAGWLAAAFAKLANPSDPGTGHTGPADHTESADHTGLVDRAEAAGPPVVHLDDLLDGWDDQVSFWPRLEEWVLAPLRAGNPGRYRRYDWIRHRFAQPWIPVPPAPVVILEGVTAARAVVRPELTCSIFVTAPARLRLDRALARDGREMLPYLVRWRRGEHVHFAADGTAARVDLVVDGAASQAVLGGAERRASVDGAASRAAVDGAASRAPDPSTHYVRL